MLNYHIELIHSDSGYDVYSVEEVVVPGRGSVVVPVGLTLAYITPGLLVSSRTKERVRI